MSRQTKPGNLERGWNDPPMFIYGSAPTGSSINQVPPKRNILTQRVAFPQGQCTVINNQPTSAPLANGDVVATSNPTAIPPPPSSFPSLPPSSSNMTSLIPGETSAFQKVQLLPPSISSEPPKFHGPVIVPTMHITTNISSSSQMLPPIATDPMSNLPVAAVMDDSELQIPCFADDEQMYHYTVTRLQRALNDCSNATEKRTVDDMQKKLNIFSDMWKNGKISYPVKSTMAKLATAIHRRKHAVAHELHLALMIDRVSEVSKWLVGVKRLIHEIEKSGVNQPISPSVSCCYGDTTVVDSSNKQISNTKNGLDSNLSINGNSTSINPDTDLSTAAKISNDGTAAEISANDTDTLLSTADVLSTATVNPGTGVSSQFVGNGNGFSNLSNVSLDGSSIKVESSNNTHCCGGVENVANNNVDVLCNRSNAVESINNTVENGSLVSRNNVAEGKNVEQRLERHVENVETVDLQQCLASLQQQNNVEKTEQHSNVQQWLDQHLVLNGGQNVDDQKQHVEEEVLQQNADQQFEQQLQLVNKPEEGCREEQQSSNEQQQQHHEHQQNHEHQQPQQQQFMLIPPHNPTQSDNKILTSTTTTPVIITSTITSATSSSSVDVNHNVTLIDSTNVIDRTDITLINPQSPS